MMKLRRAASMAPMRESLVFAGVRNGAGDWARNPGSPLLVAQRHPPSEARTGAA